MALIAQSDIEARLQRTLSADESNAFTSINSALQSSIEARIGSNLEPVSSTTRYYDGGIQHLTIDPCTSLTEVIQVDDDFATVQTYDTSNYSAYPKNRTLKTMIRHRTRFPNGLENIGVTAKFSIAEDTQAVNIVKGAMIEYLAAEVTNSDNVKKESIEGYSVEFEKSENKSALAPIWELFPGI